MELHSEALEALAPSCPVTWPVQSCPATAYWSTPTGLCQPRPSCCEVGCSRSTVACRLKKALCIMCLPAVALHPACVGVQSRC